MAKHHPDLIMCRKQPGIGIFFTIADHSADEYGRVAISVLLFVVSVFSSII